MALVARSIRWIQRLNVICTRRVASHIQASGLNSRLSVARLQISVQLVPPIVGCSRSNSDASRGFAAGFSQHQPATPRSPRYEQLASEVVATKSRDALENVLRCLKPAADDVLPLLNMLENRGDFGKCRVAFRWAADRGLLSVPHHNHFIEMLGRAKRLEEALFEPQRMRAVGLSPTTATYTSLIRACMACGTLEQAVRVFDDARADAEAPLDVPIFNAMVRACGDAGRWQWAVARYKEMQERGLRPDAATYDALIDACARGGRWHKAAAKFEEMKQRGVEPTLATYTAMVNACARGNQWERAAAVMQEMRDKGMLPTEEMCTSLLQGCARNGLWEKALRIFQDMKAAGIYKVNALAYISVIEALARGDHVEDAIEMLAEMKQAGIRVDGMTYTLLIEAYQKAGDSDKAMAMFQEMQESGSRSNVWMYNSLLLACHHVGDYKTAELLFDEMQVKGFVPDTTSYNTVLNSLWKAKQVDRARQVYNAAVKAKAFQHVEPRQGHLDLHMHSAGAAAVAILVWLGEKSSLVRETPNNLSYTLRIVTGQGKHSKNVGESSVRAAVAALLIDDLQSPFTQSKSNQGSFETNIEEFSSWAQTTKRF